MKISPKCSAKILEMIYTILGSFCESVNWEGADIFICELGRGRYSAPNQA